MSSSAWGSLPLERYVLSLWDSRRDLSSDEKRHHLSQAFTRLGDQGRYPYLFNPQNAIPVDAPPESEWQAVLSPLRTEAQRCFALPSAFQPAGFQNYGTLWLRTCYDESSDDQHAELVDSLNVDLALEVEQNLLNDITLYNYPDGDWARIFDVMPERLFRQTEADPSMLDGARKREEQLRRLRGDFTALHGAGDEGLDAAAYRRSTEMLHYLSIVGYLFVADRAALDAGKARIVFYDDHGRTVRSAFIQPDLCEDTAGAWADGLICEQPEFSEADVGTDYLPGGACGPPFV